MRRLGWVEGVAAAGVAVRVVLAVTLSETGDIEHFGAMSEAVRHHGFGAYGFLDAEPGAFRVWPYPPGFIPWLLVASVARVARFATVERVLPILADVALIWLVVGELRHRGASSRSIALAASLIALGPVFIVVSAHHGQLDGVAFVFVLAALRVWRTEGANRAVVAGTLIGVGAAIKTVPLIFVIPFVVVASRRDALRLVVAACAVPVLCLAPFLIADGRGVLAALSYAGYPGGGGLALLAQPDLAQHYFTADNVLSTAGGASWLEAHGLFITLAGIAASAVCLRRWRPPPLDGAVLLAAVTLLLAVNFYEQYLLWLLPFAFAAGHLRLGAAISVVAVPYLWAVGALPPYAGDAARSVVQLASVAVLIALFAAMTYAGMLSAWMSPSLSTVRRQRVPSGEWTTGPPPAAKP